MTLQEFYDLLKRHDWTYNYSDDHRVWQKGLDESKMIQHILMGNSKDLRFRKLYDEYQAWAFDVEGDITKPEKPE